MSSNETEEEHTDDAKSCFISLVPFVGNNELSISKPLNSLSIKFLRIDGLNHDHATEVVMA